MSNPNDINYSQSAVEEQRAIFTNRSAEFNVILRQLNPNTAEPISVINSLVSSGSAVRRLSLSSMGTLIFSTKKPLKSIWTTQAAISTATLMTSLKRRWSSFTEHCSWTGRTASESARHIKQTCGTVSSRCRITSFRWKVFPISQTRTFSGMAASALMRRGLWSICRNVIMSAQSTKRLYPRGI